MKSRPIIYILAGLVVLAALLMPLTGLAATNYWTTAGPYGGTVRSLTISPNYAADQTLFASGRGGGGVYKSTDGGSNWIKVNSAFSDSQVLAIAVSPNFASDLTLFAGTRDARVFKSTDAGASWSQADYQFGEISWVSSLAISPNYATDQTLFAGTFLDGIFKSTDAGASWSAVNNGLTSLGIETLALSPDFATDQTLFAGTSRGVFKSTDAGASWAGVNAGLTNDGVEAIAVLPDFAQDQTLFASTRDSGVYRSDDGGASWVQSNSGLTSSDVRSLAVSPDFAQDQTLFAGTKNGVFSSTDGGAHWQEVDDGFPNDFIHSLVISPGYSEDRSLFVASYMDGIFKSDDAGASWREANAGLSSITVESVVLSPDLAIDRTLFAGTYSGVFGSADGGASWNLLNSGLTERDVATLAISPGFLDDHTLFAGTRGDGVFKSTDRGLNWSEANLGLGDYYLQSLSASPDFVQDRTIFAGTSGGGIFKSVDAGDSWSVVWWLPIDTLSNSLVVSPDFAVDQTLFAGSRGGFGMFGGDVFKSTDGGDNWTQTSVAPETHITALAVSPEFARDQILFAGTSDAGVFKSTDGGASWAQSDSGLTSSDIRSLAVSPDFAQDQTLFAGTRGGGIFVSPSAGATWSQIRDGLTNMDVGSLAVSPDFAQDHEVFAGTDGGGVFSNNYQPLDYHSAWYDDIGGDNWVMMANPSSATRNLSFGLAIGGVYRDLSGFNSGIMEPGSSIAAKFAGVTGGPVKETSMTGAQGVTSQRILWPKGGNSLEEVRDAATGKLADHFYWPWYDQQSPGVVADWVLVANTSRTETLHAIVSFINEADGFLVSQETDILPEATWAPAFPGKMGGPVELKAYLTGGNWPADARDVITSQRVLSSYGADFTEVPGMPADELASEYLWSWYDQAEPGSTDWVVVANPGDTQVDYQIKIAGESMAATDDNPGTIPPHGKVTPTFPGQRNGPLEVVSTGGNIISSQRVVAGPSFEEVPGYPRDALSAYYLWPWYDQVSPGSTDWVIVVNPGDTQVDYQIKIAGEPMPVTDGNPGTIPPHGKVTAMFPGQRNGPLEVVSTGGNVMVSQRLEWKGYFTEVPGTVVSW